MPPTLAGKIQFVEAHVDDWAANAVAIGSSAAEVTALQAKTVAARAALTEQETAQATAKTKTAARRSAVEAMAVATADLIKKVRAKAATDGNTIYELANIPSPANPTPKGPPGTPEGFRVELFQDGSIKLTWKCSNPAGAQGTIYQVWRRIGTDGAFDYMGGSGRREFIDQTIPAGSTQVTYQIQGVRSTAVGVFAQFNVNFGTNSGGEMTASISDGDGPGKVAA